MDDGRKGLTDERGGDNRGKPAPVGVSTPPASAALAVEELTDATEKAITDGLRLSIALLRSQIVFLMTLSDKSGVRFGRIWGTLINEIEDLRDHLQSLYAETPSKAREKLARCRKERASHSIAGLFRNRGK